MCRSLADQLLMVEGPSCSEPFQSIEIGCTASSQLQELGHLPISH